MKKPFQLSNEENSLWNNYTQNNLDEVFHQSVKTTYAEESTIDQSTSHKKNKKSRIPLVNKHSLDRARKKQLEQNQENQPKSSTNDHEFDELFGNQIFNVLPIYQKRERNITSKYLSHGDFTDADGHITKRISRRQISIQAQIDLHNMNQHEAHTALNNFVISSSKQNLKVIRVITGKGKGGIGVIRANIEKWINMPPIRPLIIGFDYAHKSDGGMGAINILLRRQGYK